MMEVKKADPDILIKTIGMTVFIEIPPRITGISIIAIIDNIF